MTKSGLRRHCRAFDPFDVNCPSLACLACLDRPDEDDGASEAICKTRELLKMLKFRPAQKVELRMHSAMPLACFDIDSVTNRKGEPENIDAAATQHETDILRESWIGYQHRGERDGNPHGAASARATAPVTYAAGRLVKMRSEHIRQG